jgi:peptidoglycan/xylan/chitin deacetylase (PgdA/CDA1 family)
LFVPVAAFEDQLDHLLSHGWEALTLNEYLTAIGGGPRRPRTFLVTIDDGFTSVALAAPVLTSRSVPAVLFIPAGLLGGTAEWLPEPPDTPILAAEALRTLVRSSELAVGGHGWDHTPMVDLQPAGAHRQTEDVRRLLQDLTGAEVQAFAYPFGAHDSLAREAVEAAGYAVAFSVFDDRGRFAVSRVDVNSTDTMQSFRLKLVPGYRAWWRVLEHAGPLRRTVRRLATTRAAQREQGPSVQ